MNTKLVEEAVLGNKDALAFLNAMARVLHWYDDVIDRDKEMVDEHTHLCMWDALITLPTNRFYRDNITMLSPILVQSIVNWRIANDVERASASSIRDLGFAFIIRSTYVDLVSMSALIVGGVEHAVRVGPDIRRWCHQEGFNAYLTNLATEIATRKEHDHVLR